MERVIVLEDMCRFCLTSKFDSLSLIPLTERHAKQFKDLTSRELSLNEYFYPPNACLQCCSDLENLYSYKNILLQKQDELEIILQSISVTEEYTYEDDIIEEHLDENEDIVEAQDLRTKLMNEKPSVRNLSTTANKNDILKLIEDIEKNNQLIYENSKPTVMWKKRKPRSNNNKTKTETQTASVKRDPILIETHQPKLILKPHIDTSDEKNVILYQYSGHSYHSERRPTKTQSNEAIECCFQIFESHQDYKNHKRNVHHSDTITCKSCFKVLKNQKTYRIHQKSHLPASEKKYLCDVKNCTKAFNMKIHLENHLRVHSNHCPFECPMPNCTTAFKQKHQVKLHLRNKHNINTSNVISIEEDI
ncbi:hypothetical protein PVAND_013538 [Polypedilum vanderplanki]|uniref:Zinc finger protein n=1 Tax=Polypedilum vanderplanki TaxID=319348 RepID=A0A9J6CR01_POLVA|nr:hypothetical protein PVAND_013538 [Polypedilum vanderplanki]